MRILFAFAGLAPFLAGCGAVAAAKAVPTYVGPTAAAPPLGSIRIEPQTPTITRTKATYEWQVVCDQTYGSFASTGPETTISTGHPSNRLKGVLPTVFTYFIEVSTTPHGDGTMSVKITQGHRQAQTRPLLSPTTPATGGGEGYGSSESDGYADAPASSFVRPLLTASDLVKIPGTATLARITRPAPTSTVFMATKFDPKASRGMKVAYRQALPLDAKGKLPKETKLDPKFTKLEKQGYEIVSTSYGPGGTETARLIFKP